MNLIKPTSLIMLTMVLVLSACTTTRYGRNETPVAVSEVNSNSKTLDLLSQVNKLKDDNSNLHNELELKEYELNNLRQQLGISSSTPAANTNYGNTPYNQPGVSNQQGGIANNGAATGLDNSVNGQLGNAQIGNAQPTIGGVASNQGVPTTQDQYRNSYPNGTAEVANNQQLPNTQNVPNVQGNTGINNQPIANGESAQIPQTNTNVASLNTTPEALYERGFNELKQGKYDDAINDFQALLTQYPNSNLRDDAQYWTGEAHYVNRQLTEALDAFNRVVEQYPTSERTPEAHLKIGYIYADMGDIENAKRVLNDVMTLYPNDRVAASAKGRINAL